MKLAGFDKAFGLMPCVQIKRCCVPSAFIGAQPGSRKRLGLFLRDPERCLACPISAPAICLITALKPNLQILDRK